MSNPNEVPKYEPTPEMLDQIAASRAASAAEQSQAERRALEWPMHVNEALECLARGVGSLQARLAVLEAKLGIGAD